MAPPNVRVVVGDILDIDLARVLPPPAEAPRIRVVGNLPYNISSPILFRLLEAHADDGRISDATADAAEGGRRPARGGRRELATTAC